MTPSRDALDHVDRLAQHCVEVEAGLIPEDSPPMFIREDWKPGAEGHPGWIAAAFDPSDAAIEAAAEAAAQARNAIPPVD